MSPGTELHPPDDRFVPVGLADLIEDIEQDEQRFGPVRGRTRAVAEAIGHVVRQEAAALHEALDRRYTLFNPDLDTISVIARDMAALREEFDTLCRHLDYVVRKANFDKLDEVQIEAAIGTANSQGLTIRVRPDQVRHLDLYVRGRSTVRRALRTWRHPIRGELCDLEVFRRMVVVAQTTDSPHVMLKLFREIPVVDVEALLPHAEVLMSRLDRVKIIGGGAGAFSGLATKLIFFLAGGAVVATQLLWPLILALGLMSARSFFGYRRAKHYRDAQRLRHLYERNIANNAAVLHTLADSICREEIKEALLAYVFLAAPEPLRSLDELGPRVNAWLRDQYAVDVRFDVTDAIESLDRLELWTDRGRCRVVEPGKAVARLHEHWEKRRTRGYHIAAAEKGGM